MPIVAIAVVVVVAAIATVVVLRSLVVVVPADSIAVLSGRRYTAVDGRLLGYRIVGAGRVVRMPVVERVDVMSAALQPVRLSVRGAYSKGGEPLTVAARAWVGIASHAPRVYQAVERFLGQSPDQIGRVAAETLEGHVREVVARLTPEEVTSDPERFAHEVIASADDSFDKLGLVLDSLVVVDPDDLAREDFAAELDRNGLAGIAVATEVSCDAPRARPPAFARISDSHYEDADGPLPPPEPSLLADVGAGELSCRDGRATFRFTSAPVTRSQLLAAARLVTRFRDEPGAYR